LRRVFGLNGYYPIETLISRVAKPVSHLVPRALVLNGRWAYGYFHFVTEVSLVAVASFSCMPVLPLIPYVFSIAHLRMSVRALKGLACRSRLTPASSRATFAAAPILFAHAIASGLHHTEKVYGILCALAVPMPQQNCPN
jgi:hypothetical protein